MLLLGMDVLENVAARDSCSRYVYTHQSKIYTELNTEQLHIGSVFRQRTRLYLEQCTVLYNVYSVQLYIGLLSKYTLWRRRWKILEHTGVM